MIRLKSLLNENVDLLTMPNINKGLSLANALIKRGFTKEHAAAIIGNVWAESAFNHTSLGSGGDFGRTRKEIQAAAAAAHTYAAHIKIYYIIRQSVFGAL